MAEFKLLTPQQVWDKLVVYRFNYYDGMAAMYSGDHEELRRTAKNGTFWNRNSNKCRVHVPIAADIAATSANLLFSQEPTYTIFHDGEEEVDGTQQKRLEELLLKNNIASKLNEAAESCAALGDIYMKLRWNEKTEYPIIDIVQPDQAWPEYILGELRAVYFFTEIIVDVEKDFYVRVYECYTRGEIQMALYQGTHDMLGRKMSESKLQELGYSSKIKSPIDEMLAVHIANIRPNRLFRSAMHGRSDLDSLRDLCDSLDEAFSSWMRDIRLAKAKLIVPAEYLRKKKNQFLDDMDSSIASSGIFEFDADVETYVAMDINTDTAGGSGITPSQFEIRAAQHSQTCSEIILNILQIAGYSPQSFGLNVEGGASGTALNIRERKSAVTKNKKLTYWQQPLEHIFTAMIRLDYAKNPKAGSDGKDEVSVSFADSMGADASTVAGTIEMMTRAQAVSAITKVRTLHPDWSEQQVSEEVDLIKKEYMLEVLAPSMLNGDFENPVDEEKAGNETNKKNEGGDEVNA